MTREEELVRIAKKLDKMVSRNNTVRLYFDTHRWRVVPRTRPLRAGVRNCSSIEFARKIPSDLRGNSGVIFCASALASRDPVHAVTNDRQVSPPPPPRICWSRDMSQRALRPLVDSVAGRVVAAYAFASVNSVACAEGRAVPWLQKKNVRGCKTRPEMCNFWRCC